MVGLHLPLSRLPRLFLRTGSPTTLHPCDVYFLLLFCFCFLLGPCILAGYIFVFTFGMMYVQTFDFIYMVFMVYIYGLCLWFVFVDFVYGLYGYGLCMDGYIYVWRDICWYMWGLGIDCMYGGLHLVRMGCKLWITCKDIGP